MGLHPHLGLMSASARRALSTLETPTSDVR